RGRGAVREPPRRSRSPGRGPVLHAAGDRGGSRRARAPAWLGADAARRSRPMRRRRRVSVRRGARAPRCSARRCGPARRCAAPRASLLDAAEIAAVCDLGKPFAAAKDTRVHAVVLVRRSSARMRSRPTRVLRGSERLADTSELELRQTAERGWQVYRSPTERRLCKAMEQNGVSLRELCQVGYGLRTGDNPRFVARRAPRPDELALVGGEDVLPFALRV